MKRCNVSVLVSDRENLAVGPNYIKIISFSLIHANKTDKLNGIIKKLTPNLFQLQEYSEKFHSERSNVGRNFLNSAVEFSYERFAFTSKCTLPSQTAEMTLFRRNKGRKAISKECTQIC